MRLRHILCVTLIALGTPLAAIAELMVGGYPPGSPGEHPISQFSADAQGVAAPIRQIAGSATQLNGPGNISYEPVEGMLYVSDYWGQAIRVFPAFASGDIAPLRVINPAQLGQPRSSVPIAALDELIVIASNCCIYTYPLHANGSNVDRIRGINWGGGNSGTQLNNPLSLTFLPDTDEVAVVDYDFDPPYASKVVFHARTANGIALPTRILKGVNTANAAGLAHNPLQHKLYVLTTTTSDNLTYAAQIRVFSDTASDTDAPLYTIEGPATQLSYDSPRYATGIGIDQPLHRLMVSIAGTGDPATNRVLSFDLDAVGNVAPVQDLSGAGLSTGWIGTPTAVPVDTLFADGFEQ